MKGKQLLEKHKNKIKQICKMLKISKMYVFGSVLTNNFNNNSDIDFLISFANDISIEEYTDNYFELHDKLKSLLHRKVDIVTEKMLANPYFIESINENKLLFYEA
jgi:predicted nucleotidyltransferase